MLQLYLRLFNAPVIIDISRTYCVKLRHCFEESYLGKIEDFLCQMHVTPVYFQIRNIISFYINHSLFKFVSENITVLLFRMCSLEEYTQQIKIHRE
jgi:hypothetical protein